MVFDSTDENNKLLKNDVFNGIRNKIKEINSGVRDYEKYYIKINFHSDGDLPLNITLTFHSMAITIRSVFDDGKLYPQVYLDDALYELNI